jgi:hypothetical protein
MNKLLLILTALLLLASCKSSAFKKAEHERRLLDSGEIQCGWYSKKTISECRKAYPFNEAAKVVLISFPDYELNENDLFRVTDTIETPWGEKLPLPKILFGKDMPPKITRRVLGTITAFNRFYSVYEKLELNELQLDSLSYLCKNYTTKNGLISGISWTTCCYKPRNAIIFFDKNNKPLLNFEICFECGQYRSYSSNNLGHLCQIDDCGNLYNLFKDFFKKNGIHYGIDTLVKTK